MPNFQAACQQAPHVPITHVDLHPLGNLHTGGDLWFRHRLLEQVLSPFWKKVLVCCPFLDSCLGCEFEDMSVTGGGESLLACRRGALWQLWHPSVLSGDQSMDLCTHSGAPACVEAPGACSLFMPLSVISASKGFPFHLQTALTEQNVSRCALYNFILWRKNAHMNPVVT